MTKLEETRRNIEEAFKKAGEPIPEPVRIGLELMTKRECELILEAE
jgi:hypothetical protein